MNATAQQQLLCSDGFLGGRRETALVYPMLNAVKIDRCVCLRVSDAYAQGRERNFRSCDLLVYETSLRDEFDDGCLTAFKPSLWLAIPCACLLTFMTPSRGLSKTRAPSATQTFLLEDKL